MNKIYKDDFDRRMSKLDDIGFIGDPTYVFTDEDRKFMQKFFAKRRAARAKEYMMTPQVAYA